MKTRFNTYDIICSVTELQRCIGMRVNQVYDIDNKTYLIRLQRSEEKCILLLESGNRFHTTAFEWPKNNAPSGFSMKMRKHLKNKRLEKLSQLGFDRVVDFQFGTGEAAYHIILELYDRGNIVLTDYTWMILNVLRPHVEGEAVRFAVKEKYPLDRAKERSEPPSSEKLAELINSAKPGDNLKKILNPHVEYGPAVIDHVLSKTGLGGTLKPTADPNAKGFYMERDLPTLVEALKMADEMMNTASNNVSKGYIIQKKEERAKTKDSGNHPRFLLTNQEFHPFLYAQHESSPYAEFTTFDQAVDEFFSTLEGQKIDIKALQIEKEAMKKLQNVRKDHDKRLNELTKGQTVDRNRAELITRNQELVDSAILAVQSAIANQLSWNEINELVKAAQANKDPIALCIKQLKLQSNSISLALQDPYVSSENSDDDDEDEKEREKTADNILKPMVVDVDLSLTAFANARRYFDQKRSAAKKQQKTIESQTKALKSAEKKTVQTLKEVQTITNINKARKVYWFEKFYWFISSENYLVIGGRDQQQNELLVKRYMRPTDIYVHADLSGASSIIIKNPTGEAVPPKTLNEAGQMAISYSIAWEAKVVTSAWWVHAPQVSKTAPTGEYITTGSFMIRGKKNFLPPCHLVLGLTFMFRLEDGSIERHLNERRVIQQDEVSVTPSEENNEEEEIVLSGDEGEEDDEQNENKTPVAKAQLDSISEETDKIKMGKNEEDSDGVNSDSSDDESGAKFPDTHIKVEHDTGKIIMRTTSRTLSTSTVDNDEKEDVVFLGDDKPIAFPSLPQKKQKSKKVAQQQGGKGKGGGLKEEKENASTNNEKPGLKRGQKSKLKKIKEKYKDQDDEDRAFIMEMFKPDGAKKEPKKSGKKGSHVQTQQPKKKEPYKAIQEKKEAVDVGESAVKQQQESDDEGGDAEPELNVAAAETDMLCQLTGQPLPEDELLFAVPVVAPYTSLHNYKFKVKLTPGTGKRGKAAKTSIAVFLRDKACSPREKDLLKAVKDENLARNLPGKVKLSAPQLQKAKKK